MKIEIEPGNTLTDFWETETLHKDLSQAVIYHKDKVWIGEKSNTGDINDWIIDDIKEARFFSKTGEFYLYRYKGELKGRMIDSTNELSGQWEETILLHQNEGKGNCKIRHYYTFDAMGQIQFTDARLVSIMQENKKKGA